MRYSLYAGILNQGFAVPAYVHRTHSMTKTYEFTLDLNTIF
jgi:hypothetical protein